MQQGQRFSLALPVNMERGAAEENEPPFESG